LLLDEKNIKLVDRDREELGASLYDMTGCSQAAAEDRTIHEVIRRSPFLTYYAFVTHFLLRDSEDTLESSPTACR